MRDNSLSTEQLSVICALSTGATLTAAAEEAGVHRNTIQNWQRNFLPFQYALAEAQYERALYYREKIEQLFPLALQALTELIADPKTPTSVRLKAALTITQLAATPPAPKKQIELEIQKVVIEESPAPKAHNSAQLSTNAQPALKITPIKRTS